MYIITYGSVHCTGFSEASKEGRGEGTSWFAGEHDKR